MKRIVGYVRVSSKDQNVARQLDEIEKQNMRVDKLYLDMQSGCDFRRPAYRRMLREVKTGDMILIKSIDRLGRNYTEVIDQWRLITKEKGVDIRVLDMPLLDTTMAKDLLGTFISDLVLQLLSFVAENERRMIHSRQAEGIAAAKRRGVKFGRPRRAVPEAFNLVYDKWRSGELTQRAAAARLDLPVSTFANMAKRKEERELS